MQGREVVITGMGVVSPVANELSLFWERIQAGTSGIARVQSMDDIDQYPVQIGGEVKDLDIAAYVEPKEARKMDPFTIYGLAAASMAVEDAALHEGTFDPERTGVLVVQESEVCSISRPNINALWKVGQNGFLHN